MKKYLEGKGGEKMQMWRLIDTGTGSAAWNMAVDEALLEGFSQNDSPILRLYSWEPSLSFGRFSKPQGSIDLARLERQRVACARRLSGGGVLVHGNDLSYTLVLSREMLREKSVKETYRTLCGFLIRMYAKMGLKAQFAQETGDRTGKSPICLAAHEPYDILIGGKKMGGNAQRYTSRAVFQHGTIPMGFDTPLFEPLFRVESGLGDAVSLEKLGIFLTRQRVAEMAIESFCETFETRVVSGGLTSAEEKRAGELQAGKYSTGEWTFDGKQSMA
ncbi:MAG: lipoate--protein ligase family protein [Campylobacterales bacterium]|nr:lipoate--protein ligase family protein [Campylobacterales bacterium]